MSISLITNVPITTIVNGSSQPPATEWDRTYIGTNPNIVINEIMIDPHGDDAGHEWIELYNNKTETQNLNGWTVSNRTGAITTTLPNWNFPSGAYLVVYFGVGTNDDNFADGSGSFYTGNVVELFNDTEDEVALYNGIPSASTIVDFVAYSFEWEYNPDVAHDYAVNAGIWTSGDFLNITTDHPWLYIGATTARDRHSTDFDVSTDWDPYNGIDSIIPTPGTVNLYQLEFTPYGNKTSNPIEIEPQPKKNWTIMVYLDGDNDLESAYDNVLTEMNKAGSDENVNIVVMYDRKSYSFGTHADPRVRWYYLDKTKGLLSNEISHPGEKNMGDPQTLIEFANIAMNKFPADKYALFIKDHGAGWKGIATDDDSDKDRIYMGELKTALRAITVNGQNKIDLLVFDACSMANIEVFYQVKDYADVAVASTAIKKTSQFQYEKSFNAVKANPTMTARDFAVVLVNNSEDYGGLTMSAVDLSKIEDLASAVNDFASQLKDGIEDYGKDFTVHNKPEDNVQISIRNQLIATIHFRIRQGDKWSGDANYIDLYDFAGNIGNDGSIVDKWKNKWSDVRDKVVAAVIKEHGIGNGISIYFPITQTKYKPPVKKNVDRELPFDDPYPSCIDTSTFLATYAVDPTTEWGKVPYTGPPPHPLPETPDFDFRNKLWDEFLHRYYKPVADAGPDQDLTGYYDPARGQFGANVVLNGVGSSDSDGNITNWYWDLDPTVDSPLNPLDDDFDRDGVDETNDDNDLAGVTQTIWLPLGVHNITLTVWDDHTGEDKTPTRYPRRLKVGHEDHWKTDQDNLVVKISIEIKIPDSGEDLIDPATQEPAGKYKDYIDVEIVEMKLKAEDGIGIVLRCGITLNGGPPVDLEYSDQVVFYTLMLDENNDPEDNCPNYPFNDVDLMYTVVYSETYGWEFVKEKHYVGEGWVVEDTEAEFGLASSWPGGFSIDIWIPLEELSSLTEKLPWKLNTETKTYPSSNLPPIDDFVPDEGLEYLNMANPIAASDINGDRTVNILDLSIVAVSYGSVPGDERWNPDVDIDGNGVINILDIAPIAMDFGKTY